MMRFHLEWQSPAHKRYETDMNQRAEGVVQPPAVFIGSEGGTNGVWADNILIIDAPSMVEAQRLAYAVQKEVGYYVRVTRMDDE